MCRILCVDFGSRQLYGAYETEEWATVLWVKNPANNYMVGSLVKIIDFNYVRSNKEDILPKESYLVETVDRKHMTFEKSQLELLDGPQ